MNHRYLAVFATLLFSQQGLAASFDCGKAATLIEKAICANQELSQLDEQLALTYKGALSSANNPGVIKGRQRDWIKTVRNQCNDAPCLMQAYIARLEQLTQMSITVSNEQAPDRSGAAGIVIPKVEDSVVDNTWVKKAPIQLTGIIEFGHDAAGGKYEFVSGKKRYTIRYLWNLSEDLQDKLGKLDESHAKVTINGVLKSWKDGSADFDEASPVSIF